MCKFCLVKSTLCFLVDLMAVITAEPAVNYPFVKKARKRGECDNTVRYKAEMTHLPRLFVETADKHIHCKHSRKGDLTT